MGSARKDGKGSRDALHALGTTPCVAVVELETLALQDEGTDAVLFLGSHGQRLCVYFRILGDEGMEGGRQEGKKGELTWAVDVVRNAVRGILAVVVA